MPMINSFARFAAGFVSTMLIAISVAGSLGAAEIKTTAAIKPQLKPFIARYKLFRSGKEHGSAERELSVLNSLYRLRYQSSIKWLIFSDERSESSEFKLEDDRVRPLSYTMKRTGSGPDRTYRVIFDRDKQQIISGKKKRKDKGKRTATPWNEDWLDPISYQQQLVLDLQKGKKSFNYHFINRKGKAREYHFRVVSKELLTLPYGDVKAIKVERLYDSKKSKRQTFAWFAPSLDYALVRIWKAKGGTEQFDIQLAKLVK